MLICAIALVFVFLVADLILAAMLRNSMESVTYWNDQFHREFNLRKFENDYSASIIEALRKERDEVWSGNTWLQKRVDTLQAEADEARLSLFNAMKLIKGKAKSKKKGTK